MMPTTGGHDLPIYSVVGDRYTFLLTGAQTDGACFVFEAYVPPGSGSPPHVHSREDEGFYVVEGEFEFLVAGKPIRRSTGEFLFGKRGVPHNFKNVGTTPGKLIITVTPAGLEEFFIEIGEKLASRESTPIPPTPESIAKLIAAIPKYGLELSSGH
ncbi:cupin domain-containing protein [Isosphaeraceae bacterium EP7]